MSFVLTQAAILAKDYLKHYHFLGRMLGKVRHTSFLVTALQMSGLSSPKDLASIFEQINISPTLSAMENFCILIC